MDTLGRAHERIDRLMETLQRCDEARGKARRVNADLANAMKQAIEKLEYVLFHFIPDDCDGARIRVRETIELLEKALGRQEPPPPIRETVEDSAEVLRALEDR